MTTHSCRQGIQTSKSQPAIGTIQATGFSDVSGNPASPPGAGDTADRTYASSITMDVETVGDISGSDDSRAGFPKRQRVSMSCDHDQPRDSE